MTALDDLIEALREAKAAGVAGGWGGTYTEEEHAALRDDSAKMNAEAKAVRAKAKTGRL